MRGDVLRYALSKSFSSGEISVFVSLGMISVYQTPYFVLRGLYINVMSSCKQYGPHIVVLRFRNAHLFLLEGAKMKSV